VAETPGGPIHTWSALDLRRMLDAGELRSVELVQALHARTDTVDPVVRGYAWQLRDEALEAARACDASDETARSVVHGVPLSVKENIATQGTPVTLGLKARLDSVASDDAVVVDILRESGAVIMGKSNVPLLMLSVETHNDIWGTTHNPWDLSRVPGGSSGGEAALIASGQVPWGLGTDIGGSIRVPCAWCGIAGLKPTVGRWSAKGQHGAIRGQEIVRATMGPMARTSRDVAALWQAVDPIAQHERDPLVPPIPLSAPGAVDLRGLRVGVYVDDGVFQPAASVVRAVHQAAHHLAAAGAEVVPFSPPDGWPLAERYFGALSADGGAAVLAHLRDQPPTPQLTTVLLLARLPAAVRRSAMLAMRLAGQARAARIGRAFGRKGAADLFAFAAARDDARRAELAAWDRAGIDLLVGPPCVTPAAHHGRTHDWTLGGWHTMRWNLLDLPAGVVPVSSVRADETIRSHLQDALDTRAAEFEAHSEGLPLAAQIIARPFREDIVLAAMIAVEDAARDAGDFPITPVDPRS